MGRVVINPSPFVVVWQLTGLWADSCVRSKSQLQLLSDAQETKSPVLKKWSRSFYLKFKVFKV